MNDLILGIFFGIAITVVIGCVTCFPKKKKEVKDKKVTENKAREMLLSELESHWDNFAFNHDVIDEKLETIVAGIGTSSPYTVNTIPLVKTPFLEVYVQYSIYSLGSLYFRPSILFTRSSGISSLPDLRASFKEYIEQVERDNQVYLPNYKMTGFISGKNLSDIENFWAEKFLVLLQEKGYLEEAKLPKQTFALDIFSKHRPICKRQFFFIRKDSSLLEKETISETPEIAYRESIRRANRLKEFSLREAILNAEWVTNKVSSLFSSNPEGMSHTDDLIFGNDILLPAEETFIRGNKLTVQQNEFLYQTTIAAPEIEHTMDQLVTIYHDALTLFFSDYGALVEIFYLEEESVFINPKGALNRIYPAEYRLTFRIAEVKDVIRDDLHS